MAIEYNICGECKRVIDFEDPEEGYVIPNKRQADESNWLYEHKDCYEDRMDKAPK